MKWHSPTFYFCNVTYRIFCKKNLGWDLKYPYPLELDWIIKSGCYITDCNWNASLLKQFPILSNRLHGLGKKKLFQRRSRLLFFFIKDYKGSFFFGRMYTYDLTWVIILLHFPWYCAVRSGCLLHLALRSAHSFRYVFPSEPHTGPLKVTLEQSGAHTQRGLFRLFILHLFPGPQSTLSQVSVESIKKVMNNWSNELNISSVYINVCGLMTKSTLFIYIIYTIFKLKSSYRLTIQFKMFSLFFQIISRHPNDENTLMLYLYKVCSLVHHHWRSATGRACYWVHPPRSTPCPDDHFCNNLLDSSQTCTEAGISRSCPAEASSCRLERVTLLPLIHAEYYSAPLSLIPGM